MRPSFVQQYPKPLANSYGCLDEDSSLANGSSCAADAEIVTATAFLEETLVPRLAAHVQQRYRDTALDQPDWRSVMHVAGLNMRHLGLLRDSLDLSCQHLRGWLLLEMIARTLKSELRCLYRDAAGRQDAVLRRHTAAYLNMVFGNFPQSKEYRCRELKQRLQEKFRRCALDEEEEAGSVDLLALDQLPSSLLAERLHELGVVRFSREVRQRLAFLPLPFALPSVALLEAGDISCPPVVKDAGLLSLEKTLLHAAWPQPHGHNQQTPESGAWEHAVCGLAHLAPLLQHEGSNWHARNAAAAIYLRLARWYGRLGGKYLEERLHCLCLAVEHSGVAALVAPRSPIALSGHALALHRCADALTALLPHLLDRRDLALVPAWLREVLSLLAAGSLSYGRALEAEPAWPAAADGWAQLVEQQKRICAKETLVDVLKLTASQAELFLSHLTATVTHARRLASLEATQRERPSVELLQTLELLYLAVAGRRGTGRLHALVSPLLQQRSRYQTSIACETVPASCWLVFCDRAVGRLLEEESTRQVVGRLLVREPGKEQSLQGQVQELRRLLEVEQLQREPVASLFRWLSTLLKRCERTTEAPAFRSMYFVTVVTLLKVASLSGEQEVRLQDMFDNFRRVCKSLGRTTLTFCDCYGISTDEDFIRSVLDEEEALYSSSMANSPVKSPLSPSFLRSEGKKGTSSLSTGDLPVKKAHRDLREHKALSRTLPVSSPMASEDNESGAETIDDTSDSVSPNETEESETEREENIGTPEISREDSEQSLISCDREPLMSDSIPKGRESGEKETTAAIEETHETESPGDSREPDLEPEIIVVSEGKTAEERDSVTGDRSEAGESSEDSTSNGTPQESEKKRETEEKREKEEPESQSVTGETEELSLDTRKEQRESSDNESESRAERERDTERDTEKEIAPPPDTPEISPSDGDSLSSSSGKSKGGAPGALTPNTARRERALTSIVCQGKVVKKGSGRGMFGRHNWKQRTLVLSRSSLRYYASEGLLLGSIDELSAISTVESEFSKKGGYAIRLVMTDPRRPFFTFVVQTVQDRDQWLAAFRQVLPALS